ncbi:MULTISPECIES: 50S ribosomal protein L25/general stress protein Ctc [unclassified Enterococcus]|uniref:50S ribosomal protein L25/general stress protein Ctc n=1 Tax=unclassified Enterococcus TaxID=2608891 RepID=UPI001CE120AA|nr:MULTISPECIES: 50S ribosomal protein L25/general stress protein Ctc [unclassified Enterococcus]MCA5012235.1 50S ribosomal protein L25/general stress protein Ctc [Enterococcus sp. S23]MCA5015486.1 50S ribosomal protein L25/general stress protein Ctc [Enterococcus sp. S22(2020)]
MSVSLEVKERAVRPRSLRNQLRHSGQVPAVVYGYEIESTPISVEEKELTKILRDNGVNAVITMTVGGKKINTLMYKAQLDTFTGQMKHVEFLAVNMKEATEVEAEIVLVGESAGVKSGGVLAQNLYNVLVSATPDKLPERVEVDITDLAIGDAITVADLPKNNDYDIITEAEEQIAAVVEAQAAEEETPEEAAEPTVIGEKEE